MNKFFKSFFILTLLFPLILIFIVVSMLGSGESNNGSGESGNVIISENISPEVLKWQPLVEKYAKQFGIPEYVPLILAMIQQESGGNTSLDVMQSAEGQFNTRYPKDPNGILDPDYSVWCGVQEIKEALRQAGVKDLNDTQNLNIALQAYNMGTGFIGYARANGGYSLDNAKKYSQEQAIAHGWARYGDPLYIPHVLRYYTTTTQEASSEMATKAVAEARRYIGAPYVWGASGPKTFDCSGLVYYAYSQVGYKIGRTTAQGYHNISTPVSNPSPGDLIFFRKSGDIEDHHIGIYVGPNKMIEAPYTGAFVRETTYLNRPDFIGYGRLK